MKLFLWQLLTTIKPIESVGDETTAVDHTTPNQPSSPTRTVYPPTRGPSHRRSTRKETSSGSRFEHIRRQTTLMLTPPKKLAPPPTFFHSLKAILFASCELIFASTIRSSLNHCRVEYSSRVYTRISERRRSRSSPASQILLVGPALGSS